MASPPASRLVPLGLVLLMLSSGLAGCLGDANPLESSTNGQPDETTAERPGSNDSPNATSGNASIEWPPVEEAVIRPGVDIASGVCTAAFVFTSTDQGHRYVSTASHCFHRDGDSTPVGANVSIAGIEGAGVLAYTSDHAMEESNGSFDRTTRISNDFALVRLQGHHRSEVHPAVKGFGGPTEVANQTHRGESVAFYGNSSLKETPRGAAESLLKPSEGYVEGYDSDRWEIDFYPYKAAVFGDSGSPLLTGDGEALGVVTGITTRPPAANVAVNLTKAVDFAEAYASLDVTLVEWDDHEGGILPSSPTEASPPALDEGS